MNRRALALLAVLAVIGALLVSAPAQASPRAATAGRYVPGCAYYDKDYFAQQSPKTIGQPYIFYERIHSRICWNASGYLTSVYTWPLYSQDSAYGYALGWVVDNQPWVYGSLAIGGYTYKVRAFGAFKQCIAYYTGICSSWRSVEISLFMVAPAINGGYPPWDGCSGCWGQCAGCLYVRPSITYDNFALPWVYFTDSP